MKKTAKTCTFVILKGNKDVEGVMIKQNAVEVIARFAKKVFNSDCNVGKYSVVLSGIPTDTLGDPQIMNETVFRKADIYGTTNSSESEARAEKLYAAYQAMDPGVKPFGVAVIRYLLDKMYVQYDIIE